MKLHQLAGIVFISMVLAGVLSAQTPATLPGGPLISKAAPEFAKWKITTKTGASTDAGGDVAAQKSTSSFGSQMEVVKTGNIRHVTLERGNGSKMEYWCEGDLQVITCPEWPQPVVSGGMGPNGGGARLDFSHGDFGDFDWITAATFAGIQKLEGSDCLVFQKEMTVQTAAPLVGQPTNMNGGGASQKPPMAKAVACVDSKTRLPVSLQSGDQMTTYTFDDPPTSKLKLPPEIQTAIDNYLAEKKRLQHVPVHP